MSIKETATGKLFGEFWSAYNDEQFQFSVELLARRFVENDFDMHWFKGKKCLDIGCGGGRYSIALAGLGAREVVGMDIGEAGITDAKKRAADMGLPNVHFQVGSALDIPFPDSSFDCVIFSGVIQHVERPMRALREIGRVTKPGGMFYSLTYATEGVRWPMIQMLRPIVQRVGFETMDKAVGIAGLPANRRRTYLDDFFVPMIDFYCWERLSDMMKHVGFSKIERWKKGRLDHEETLATYKRDLEGFQSVMHAAAGTQSDHTALLEAAVTVCDACVKYVSDMEKEVKNGVLSEPEAMNLVVGQGHHRVVAWKDNN